MNCRGPGRFHNCPGQHHRAAAFGHKGWSKARSIRPLSGNLSMPCLIQLPTHASPPPCSRQDGYQPRYFVLQSFEEGVAQLKAYCRPIMHNIPDEVRAAVQLHLP